MTSGAVDSLDCKVNYDLSSISHKNLKAMERHVGQMIEDYAEKSMANATKVSFDTEMR